jgi:hypothetical protein
MQGIPRLVRRAERAEAALARRTRERDRARDALRRVRGRVVWAGLGGEDVIDAALADEPEEGGER